MKTISKLALALTFTCVAAMADTHWTTGQVLNFGPASVVTGPASPDAAMTSHAPEQVVFIPNNVAWDAVVIRSGNNVFLCRERRQFDSKPASLTLGDSVQFYRHGNQIVFRDSAGKRHRAYVITPLS